MALRLKAQAAFPENQISFPRGSTQSSVNPVPGDRMLHSGLPRLCMHMV